MVNGAAAAWADADACASQMDLGIPGPPRGNGQIRRIRQIHDTAAIRAARFAPPPSPSHFLLRAAVPATWLARAEAFGSPLKLPERICWTADEKRPQQFLYQPAAPSRRELKVSVECDSRPTRLDRCHHHNLVVHNLQRQPHVQGESPRRFHFLHFDPHLQRSSESNREDEDVPRLHWALRSLEKACSGPLCEFLGASEQVPNPLRRRIDDLGGACGDRHRPRFVIARAVGHQEISAAPDPASSTAGRWLSKYR